MQTSEQYRSFLLIRQAVRNGYPESMPLTTSDCAAWLDAQENINLRDDCRGTSNADAVHRAIAFEALAMRYRDTAHAREFICTQKQADAIAESCLTDVGKIVNRDWFHVAPLD